MTDPDAASQRDSRKRARPTVRTLCVAAAAAILVVGSGQLAYAGLFQARGASVSSPAPCALAPDQPPAQPPPRKPTTITTLQQAYECIFAHYYSGSKLDDRTLLTGGFAGFTAELQRRSLDGASATLPKLTGNRDSDWEAFAKTYQHVLATLPENAELRQALATATMTGMIEALHDDHAGWSGAGGAAMSHSDLGFQYTFEGRPAMDVPPRDIRDAVGPMYITALDPGSAAARAGLKAGDVIEAVDGVPVFVDGKLTPGDLDLLNPRPGQDRVEIRIHRPATGKTWTVELSLRAANPTPPTETVKLLHGHIVYVGFPAFDPGAVDRALAKIAKLRASSSLRGIILDVRGNGGGDPTAVGQLLGAFIHHKIWAWDCDVQDHCTARRADDTVALLNLSLVVLTDGRCVSACDAFSAAVKDLRLGQLVGTRTAGVVSGPAQGYILNDNTMLGLPAAHEVMANGEIVDGIGVAVNYQAPMTAQDLSDGRDPALKKALSLLTA